MKKYTNRYGDVYTFTTTKEGNILWEGPFEWCRFGIPNDYTKAYEAYVKDGGDMSLNEFKDAVHTYDSDKQQYTYHKYTHLVTSIVDKINMIDPSGGPYIAVGMPSETYSDVVGKRIVDFKKIESGYEIILD